MDISAVGRGCCAFTMRVICTGLEMIHAPMVIDFCQAPWINFAAGWSDISIIKGWQGDVTVYHVSAYKTLAWLILIALISLCLDAAGQAEERYVTQRGDTLWAIAGRYIQDGALTTEEMMWELFYANPDAFIDYDIDRLKIGYVLHIPVREAPRETSPAPVAETLPQAPPVETPDTAPDIAAEAVSRLQSELAQTQARATQQHAENEALQARIAALEAQAMQRHETATTPHAADRSGAATWFNVPNLIAIVIAVLALATLWRRRTAPQTREPLALEDMEAETRLADETASGVILQHLIIDVEDLDLTPSSGRSGAA